MKRVLYITLLLFAIINLSSAQVSPNKHISKQNTSLYTKAGVIKIKDNKAIAAGTMRTDGNIFTISLEDIGVFDGHICACNTAGFIITKNVLAMLFPGQTPMRNSMNIRMSSYTQDMVDAIEFITGNRLDGGKYTEKKSDFVIDTTLQGEKGTVTFIFERKDNGKKVKVVLDKKVLLSKEEMNIFTVIKPKMAKKTATKEEKEKLRKATMEVVEKEITNMPKGAITYEAI